MSSGVLRAGAGAVAAVVVAGLLGGCSGGASGPATSGDSAGRPTVVASTDVWGSVAQSVAGPDARVSSIVSGSADPHSFEPAPAAVAAISDATVVVYNGGGYDAWAGDILDQNPDVASIEAFALLDPAALGEAEPADVHVFYDMNTAKAVADRVADALAAADPAHTAGYRTRAADFGRRAEEILVRQRALRTTAPGASVVATEPVAHYLLLAAGVADRTPAGFTAAVSQDNDPAPVDIAAMLDLLTAREVSALIFNDQTVTGVTRQVRDAAEQSGIPVVAVTETLPAQTLPTQTLPTQTLPAQTDFLGWQSGLTDRLADALSPPR